MRPVPRARVLAALLAASLLLLPALFAATPSLAQSGPIWIALDTQPAGTPASVVFNADASSASQSTMDVTISGFWVTQKIGTDGRIYQTLEVPGLQQLTQLGAPNLPACRFDLGVVSGAGEVAMQPPVVFASVSLPGYLIWPEPQEIMLHEGSDEVFTRDETIYATPGLWPASDGLNPVPLHTLLGLVPDASCECYPLRWDPVSGVLNVATHVRYRFSHPGPGLTLPFTTRPQRNVVSHLVANWQTVGPSVIADPITYSGYYLIICPQDYAETLQPLVDQKKAHGLKVTELFVEDVGSACGSVQIAIGNWYNGTPKGAEHYCLLVGDVDVIPLCSGPGNNENPFGVFSDDPYGAPFVLDNDRQVMVGRLSPISPSELAWNIAMIIGYEDTPASDGHYGDVLLVAHGGTLQNTSNGTPIPPFQEKVRTAAYASPPNFTPLYGNVQGVNNAQLSAALLNGYGLVDYFGHGFLDGWWCWDLTCQNFYSFDVGILSLAPRNPLVWSIACESGAIQTSDCFGENFTHRYGLGALGFYGSTVNAGAWPSIELNQDLFFAVFSQDIRIQGFTYYDAEYRMENYKHSGDSWKYLLLGDPEMTIRTTEPDPPIVSRPWVEHLACVTCPEIKMHVMHASGAPGAGVRVAVWQPGSGAPGNASRAGAAGAAAAASAGVQDNRYADASGLASIPAPTLADGMLFYSAVDDSGNAVRDSVRIQNGEVTGVGDDGAAAHAASLSAMPSVVRSGTAFLLGRPARGPARLDIYDAIGRRVRTIPIEPGSLAVRWDAGNESGLRVSPGVYLASFREPGGQAHARVVVLR